MAELKALSPANAGDTLRDGDGLVGTARAAGAGPVAVHFRYGFKRDGKKAWHSCGTWPAPSSRTACRARMATRSFVGPSRRMWCRLLQEGNATNLIEIERTVAADHDMSNIRTRVLSPAETQLTLWICLSTCRRIGELLMTMG